MSSSAHSWGEGTEGCEGGEEDLASTSKGWKRSGKGTVRGAGWVVDWAGRPVEG